MKIEDIHTFDDLSDNYSIIIPLIQRDYVQGADRHSDKRNEFVKSLLDCLKTGRKLHLDFIYGTGGDSGQDDRPTFYPLDGQQRLTTLFLLHWLLEVMTGRHSGTADTISYQSRRSSEQFCHKLCSDAFDRNFSVKVSADGGHDSVSDTVKECTVKEYIETVKPWFVCEWSSDPTIKAMLEMLDYLQTELKPSSEEELALMLNNFDSISFDIIALGRYDLSDSLYVKMNERGKQLTDFENWKASFIGFLDRKFANSPYDFNDKNLKDYDTFLKYFEHSIEHKWTDLLWDYALSDWDKSGHGEDNYPMIDNYFMRIFTYIHRLLFFSSNPKINGKDVQARDYDDSTESQEKIFSNSDNLSFLFDFLDLWYTVKNQEGGIEAFFDKLLGAGAITLWDNNERSNLFAECISARGMDVKLEVLFYAISKFCLHSNCYEVTDELKLFTRTCRNLIESIYSINNSDVSCETNVRVTDWSKYKSAIDDFVNNERLNENITGFGDANHEAGKLKIRDPRMREFIEKWEDNIMFKGCLRAILPSVSEAGCEVVDNALTAFEKADNTEKVQIFIAFDYHGYNTGKCAYYTRDDYFFGKDGKWDVIFRHDCENVKASVSRFILSYAETPDISKLIEMKQMEAPKQSFKYYMLKYKDILEADLNNITYYFAIKGDRDNLDLIHITKYSSKPLMAYHCDPFAYAVVNGLNSKRTINFWSQYNEKSGILLPPGTDLLKMSSQKDHWLIKVNDGDSGDAESALNRIFDLVQGSGYDLTKTEKGLRLSLKEHEDLIGTGTAFLKGILD